MGTARLLVAAVLLLALRACGHPDLADDPSPGPHPSPTRAGQCDDLPSAHGDGGVVLGTDWSSQTHPYDEPVDLIVCVTPSAGHARARVTSPDPGVTVAPTSQPVPVTGNGLLTVQVRVTRGAPSRIPLRVVQEGRGVGGDLEGPVVVRTRQGWHFARAH